MTITREHYFQGKPHTPEHEALADQLLGRVNRLLDEAEAVSAWTRRTCPNTGTEISGSKGGAGDGGFRLETSTTGSGKSSHKEAKGVDVYDPRQELDAWLDSFEVLKDGERTGGNLKLEAYNLYREDPDATSGWCHLTTRAPASGRRTFKP